MSKALFISETVPAEIEMVVPTKGSISNKAPVVFLVGKKDGIPTSKIAPSEQIVFSAEAKDPDSPDSSQLTTTWTADTGTLATSVSNPFQVTWTAPNSLGVGNIGVRVTDQQGAWGGVKLKILVGLNQLPGDSLDASPPTILSFNPASGASNIELNPTISVTFDEFIATPSVNTETFSVSNGGSPLPGTALINSDGKSISFIPSGSLPVLSKISVQLKGIKDLAGNLVPELTWTFDTGAGPDTTTPTVVSVDPAINATNVATSSKITLQFSEAMASATVSGTSFKVASGSTAISGTITLSGDGKIATFAPSAMLPYSGSITVTISTGVTDLAGNAMAATYSWSFKTMAAPDTTPPTVVSVIPASGSTNIATTTALTVTFSEAMATATLNTTNITLASGATPVAGTVSISSDGKIATFSPGVLLSQGTVYSASVKTGVTDSAGNALAANFNWSFTTKPPDFTPPTVVLVVPATGATDIATNTLVTITFSEPMDAATLNTTNIKLASGATDISGTVSVSADKTIATFTPTSSLARGAVYTVTAKTGITDLAGNALTADFVSTFTTVLFDNLPPGYNSVGFPAPSASLTVHAFSSSMTAELTVVNTTGVSQAITVTTNIGVSPKIGISTNLGMPSLKLEPPQLTQGQKFHNFLRNFEKLYPPPQSSMRLNAFGNQEIPPVRSDAVGSTTTFNILDSYPIAFSAPSTCRKVVPLPGGSGNAYFYVDDGIGWGSTSISVIDSLASAWPTIYSRDKFIFGNEPASGSFNNISVTNDLWILIAPPAKMNGNLGFFWSGDLWASGTYPPSNGRKIFYIAYYTTPEDIFNIKGTLAHEFQHMINYAERKAKGVVEQAWLDESMGQYATHICNYGIQYGDTVDLQMVNSYFSGVATNSLSSWSGTGADYGKGYLFGTWLGQKYGANESVKALLQTNKVGTEAVELFTGKSFSTILGEWAVALYVNDYSGGLYGLRNINLKGTYFYPWGTYSLNGIQPISINSHPNSSNSTVANDGVAYFEYSGGNGNSLNFSLPGAVTVYELHK